jgi:hypothetical protein
MLRHFPDFLRISRASIDDSITQNLNALLTPASKGFNPVSTNSRQHQLRGRQPGLHACQTFKDKVLFPSWQMRSDVIAYCTSVATSPDPDDPEAILRDVEVAQVRDRVVDERLDPYSARYFPRESRTESLASTLRNEKSVEAIIRSRTWGLVAERCGSTGIGWEEALNRWRVDNEGRP